MQIKQQFSVLLLTFFCITIKNIITSLKNEQNLNLKKDFKKLKTFKNLLYILSLCEFDNFYITISWKK